MARSRVEEQTATNDISLRRCMDFENKYEQLVLAKERLANELKFQRDISAKELEILKASESFLRKSIDDTSQNYNTLLQDMFKLKVHSSNPGQL